MRNYSRKLQKQKRKPYSFPGLDLARPLLNYLNPHEEIVKEGDRLVRREVSYPRSNLTRIIRHLKQLEGLTPPSGRRYLLEVSTKTPLARRVTRLENVLARRMKVFTIRPAIRVNRMTFGMRDEKPLREFPTWKDDTFFKWVGHSVNPVPVDIWEIQGFQILEQIVKNGWLKLLIVCPGCSCWAWKKKKDQRTCGEEACRQKTPETKEQRKRNARYKRKHGK
jgi:hypothetical protein